MAALPEANRQDDAEPSPARPFAAPGASSDHFATEAYYLSPAGRIVAGLRRGPGLIPMLPATVSSRPRRPNRRLRRHLPQSAELCPSTNDVAALIARGDAFLQVRDIAAARLYCERAADAPAMRMGETFDPAFLARVGIRGTGGNERHAVFWYRRARDLGDSEPERLRH